ncbi:putative methyltransferase [Geosmithia morbida]|uniref:Methyltransferase n=1 Tax=Geosmithia morbida TaxID=1094350 RepID=A0A9P4YXD6_9HYPO|nr:putative methyltransferase [Geosmithia morbida]KAF4122774.1 putative methyltransferase [Geosmithia morbida]
MHYVRCLRRPKVTPSRATYTIELLFIISTDLGDSLLFPDEPIDLSVTAYTGPEDAKGTPLASKGQVSWKTGQRVVKQDFGTPPTVTRALSAGKTVQLRIGGPGSSSADSAHAVAGCTAEDDGLIMPLWVAVHHPSHQHEEHVSTRKLRLPRGTTLEIAEDIGEPKSLARHVWDGGLAAVCGLAEGGDVSGGPCLRLVREMIARGGNILELGCGVGVLGLGTALVADAMRGTLTTARTSVVMTDLEDAEEQVRSNMGRVLPRLSRHDEEGEIGGIELVYENLDWEDGSRGRFGPAVASRSWDLIMLSDCTYNVDVLPALVGTLEALHAANVARGLNGGTRVFIATKPRHESETEAFDLLNTKGWSRLTEQTIPLPVMGEEPQRVELYLYERR